MIARSAVMIAANTGLTGSTIAAITALRDAKSAAAIGTDTEAIASTAVVTVATAMATIIRPRFFSSSLGSDKLELKSGRHSKGWRLFLWPDAEREN
ncbi:hypothetical protein [Pararhizobium sp. PWRC1-1]|uniref:hypothetical protein n=1 Tax=Pararhizobium sp. PWRC1-1 TaxID=2804566 RepID=UPI003CF21104